ncbi:DUF3575 domain-containing protein [Flavobacterium sp. GT3R68]|uniref:DUF3575 domain-containing protein n=1 Tax=Flavobacterium sp. GT3R68 TaxID=2594437 RepID=UPI000F8682CB|nr:DUF3575 domain-containing protein [Flavobacterium sp. GT3R68]RTY95833.1 DUF3575 domain-containing protein [Flavobacterium sp. GSN2]TRW93605.1 DUF3575 domain-containing protein [Flavobacterium sp. GT3R68]
MKKFAISLLLLTAPSIHAQETIQTSDASLPRNEVKWNITNTIVFGSVEVGYEYFLDGNQSLGVELLINDVYNFSIGREYKDFETNSVQFTYNYYTGSENNGSGFYISPLLKYRFGEYQKTPTEPIISMDSFILGIGGGYKWNLSNKFVFGPYINIARDFSQEVTDEFTAVEINAGFSVGYRF